MTMRAAALLLALGCSAGCCGVYTGTYSRCPLQRPANVPACQGEGMPYPASANDAHARLTAR